VGVVNDEPCPVLVADVAEFAQRGDVALHGVDAVNDDHLGPRRAGRHQDRFQVLDVVVAEKSIRAPEIRPPHTRLAWAVAVQDDQVARAGQRRHAAHHGLGPVREDQGPLRVLEVGQHPFQFGVQFNGARQRPGAHGALTPYLATASTAACRTFGWRARPR